MIEQVESCGAEVETEALRHGESLLQRGIDLVVAGAIGDVSSQVSPGSVGRRLERGWVEPVVDRLVRRINRHAGDKVGSLAGRILIRQRRRLSRERDVHGESGTRGSYTGDLPS